MTDLYDLDNIESNVDIPLIERNSQKVFLEQLSSDNDENNGDGLASEEWSNATQDVVVESLTENCGPVHTLYETADYLFIFL